MPDAVASIASIGIEGPAEIAQALERAEQFAASMGERGALRAALDVAPVALAVWDARERLVYANRLFLEQASAGGEDIAAGMDFEAFANRMAEVFFPAGLESRRERWLTQRLAAFRNHDVRELALPGQAWRRVQDIPFSDGTLTLIEDIAEQRARELELRQVEERFTLAQLSAKEALWDIDFRTGQFYLAPHGYQLLGVNRSDTEFATARWRDLILPEDRADYDKALGEHLSGEAVVFNCEYRVVDPEGGVRWLSDRGMALRDSTGRAYRFAGSLVDVTQDRQTHENLKHAMESAEVANRSKSAFLANMSHELRTPLNAIIGFAEMIESETFGRIENEHYREYVGDILHSANHLLDIINDVLDLSKAEAGKLELVESPVDIEVVFDAVFRMTKERADEAGVAVIVDCPPNVPALFCDERKLRQVLLNLASNAIKFTKAGGEVRVQAFEVASGGFQIVVSDTGIGMDKEDIPRALAAFEQVDNALSRRFDGTGLGLPIAATLARLHQGDLKLDSAPGKGTTVTVYLPASRVIPRNPGPEKAA